MQKVGFSRFSWALALFCIPCAFWPLALLVSPHFFDQSELSSSQITLFSTAFWLYPFVLLAISGILFKVHKTQPQLARFLLIGSFIGFYGLMMYILMSV